jgi:hypothetical protein
MRHSLAVDLPAMQLALCLSKNVGAVLLLLPLQCAGLRPAPIRFGDEMPEGDTAVVRRDVIVPARAIAVSGVPYIIHTCCR